MAWCRFAAAIDVLIPSSHFHNRGGGSSRFCLSGLVLRGVACRDASSFECVLESNARLRPLPTTTTSTDAVYLLGGVATTHILMLVASLGHCLLPC
jgi:hypothetical protein